MLASSLLFVPGSTRPALFSQAETLAPLVPRLNVILTSRDAFGLAVYARTNDRPVSRLPLIRLLRTAWDHGGA